MMKKNNGGYVLIYVMIVITIVSAMALAVSSVALRNYQVQRTAVERMKNLYAAEGEIERFHAWVMGQPFNQTTIEAYPTTVDPPVDLAVSVTVAPVAPVNPLDPYTITVTATAGNAGNTTTVTAVMVATVVADKVNGIEYTSYDIT